MDCPRCNTPKAYIGFIFVECCNEQCECYNAVHASAMAFSDSENCNSIDRTKQKYFKAMADAIRNTGWNFQKP